MFFLLPEKHEFCGSSLDKFAQNLFQADPDCFVPCRVGLRHDEFDVLLLDALSVFLSPVVLVFLHSRQRGGRVLQTTISFQFVVFSPFSDTLEKFGNFKSIISSFSSSLKAV